MIHISKAVIAALAVCGSVQAIPAVASSADSASADCVSTEGAHGTLATALCGDQPSSTAPPMDTLTVNTTPAQKVVATQTLTSTFISTTTVFAMPSAPSLKLEIPEGYILNEDLYLWSYYGAPILNNMADMINQTAYSWQEIAAVADVIIHHEPRWLPAVVFSAPSDFYTDQNPYLSQKRPRVRTNADGEVLIFLEVFPASDDRQLIKVTISSNELDEGYDAPLWVRFIMKAVDHPHVRDVWAKKYPVDMWDQVPAAGANKTMAIFEMLTGYEVEPKSKSDYSDAKALMDDLKGSSLEPGMESGKGIDANPTIIYDQDGGMRPLIWNLEGDSSNFTAADFPVRLLDCRNAGTMNKTWIQQLEAKRYYAQYRNNTAYTGDLEAHDRFKSEQTLFDDMSWIVRLADKRSLNFTEGIENIKPDAATFGSYFYENVMPMKYYSNMDNTTLNISESNTQAPNNTDASNITITGYNTEAKNTTDGGNATANGEQSPDTSGGQ